MFNVCYERVILANVVREAALRYYLQFPSLYQVSVGVFKRMAAYSQAKYYKSASVWGSKLTKPDTLHLHYL